MTTFLIIALLAYNAWLAYHLLSRPSASKGQTASEEETKKKREAQDEVTRTTGKDDATRCHYGATSCHAGKNGGGRHRRHYLC